MFYKTDLPVVGVYYYFLLEIQHFNTCPIMQQITCTRHAACEIW